jgi:hypothetical protein
MTDQELHKVFEENLPIVKSHLNFYAEGDMDHVQNGLTNMYASIVTNNEKNKKRKEKKSLNTRYLKNAIRWGIICEARRGCSVDSDIKSFKRRERDIEIIRADAVEAAEVKDYIFKDRRLGVEDVAIGRISYERFIESLTSDEKCMVLSKLRGELRDELYNELGQYKFMATFRNCREKFRMIFEC